MSLADASPSTLASRANGTAAMERLADRLISMAPPPMDLPPAAIVRAVAEGKVDVSLVWGPLAGYFAKSSPVPLRVERITPWLDNAQWPMVYDISMGVRKYDPAFQQKVETILARRRTEIAAVLDRYGVPRVD